MDLYSETCEKGDQSVGEVATPTDPVNEAIFDLIKPFITDSEADRVVLERIGGFTNFLIGSTLKPQDIIDILKFIKIKEGPMGSVSVFFLDPKTINEHEKKELVSVGIFKNLLSLEQALSSFEDGLEFKKNVARALSVAIAASIYGPDNPLFFNSLGTMVARFYQETQKEGQTSEEDSSKKQTAEAYASEFLKNFLRIDFINQEGRQVNILTQIDALSARAIKVVDVNKKKGKNPFFNDSFNKEDSLVQLITSFEAGFRSEIPKSK